MKKKEFKGKMNKKVVLYSIIGIVFFILAYTVNWMFIGVSAIMILLNQRELMK